jgi:hypothetical protein
MRRKMSGGARGPTPPLGGTPSAGELTDGRLDPRPSETNLGHRTSSVGTGDDKATTPP